MEQDLPIWGTGCQKGCKDFLFQWKIRRPPARHKLALPMTREKEQRGIELVQH